MHSHGNDNEKLAAQMPSQEDCAKIAGAFAQLGDGTRLKILWILCHSEQCVSNIAQLIGMSSPAVAHHLKLLKSAKRLCMTKKALRTVRFIIQ